MSLDHVCAAPPAASSSVAPSSTPDEPAVLFFDADGTLVWMEESDLREGDADFNDYGPSPLVQDAFAKLHERGHLPILCTGRPLPLVPESLRALNFAGYILGAGSCIMLNGEVAYEEFIPRDVVLTAAEMLLRSPGAVLLESRTSPVFLSPDPAAKFFTASVPVVSSIEELLRVAPDLPFNKMSSATETENPFTEEFCAYAEGEGNLVGFNMGFAREYCLAGVDKGTGIRHVLEHLGRGTRNTYAFGDSENDLPMFAAVETKIAMGNAMDSVKAQADHVTTHAKDDGIPAALHHFGLI